MKTELIQIDPHDVDQGLLIAPATALRLGSLVAFPTETVYGLGANALLPESVRSIFRTKGRPNDNPLIVHVADWEQIDALVKEVSLQARFIMQRFMPGPFTAVLTKKSCVPDEVSAGLSTVGIRIPENEVARCFLRQANCPVAAPSANLSGKPSPTTAFDCWEDLQAKIPYILDGGPCAVGVESTVVDLTGDQPRILRPGAVTNAMLEKALLDFRSLSGVACAASSDTGVAAVYQKKLTEGETPAAPGMKYRHYAPAAQVYLLPLSEKLDGEEWFGDKTVIDAFCAQLERKVAQHSAAVHVGLYASAENITFWQKRLSPLAARLQWEVYAFARNQEEEAEYAALATHHLFAALRQFDRSGVDFILAEQICRQGVGEAYMNRLTKAASAEIELAPHPAVFVEVPAAVEDKAASEPILQSQKEILSGFTLLFVCTGNTCRSPMAEYLFRALLFKEGLAGHYLVQSAGTDAFPGEAATDLAIAALAERGIDLCSHRSQNISHDLAEQADIILTMTERHKMWLLYMYPQLEGKVYTFTEFVDFSSSEIADPYGQPLAVYQATAAKLDELAQLLLRKLNALEQRENC